MERIIVDALNLFFNLSTVLFLVLFFTLFVKGLVHKSRHCLFYDIRDFKKVDNQAVTTLTKEFLFLNFT